MVVLALLSIGAIYALIPVVIILILIAAAAGLRGGGDLFTLLGFGAIMQMATGFGAGGAGKGLSKATEFREAMSTGTSAKGRMGDMGKRRKATNNAKKAAKEAAYLKTPASQAATTKVIAKDYAAEIGKTKRGSSFNDAERAELKNRISKNLAAPREYFVDRRLQDLKAHSTGKVNLVKQNAKAEKLARRDIRGMIKNTERVYGPKYVTDFVRGNVRSEYGAYGLGGWADFAYRAINVEIPYVTKVPFVGQMLNSTVGAYGGAFAAVVMAAHMPFRALPKATRTPPPLPTTDPWSTTYSGSASPPRWYQPRWDTFQKMYLTNTDTFSWGGAVKNTFRGHKKFVGP